MRLLNVNTLQFSQFHNHEIPKYVVASHRWAHDEENTFMAVQKRRNTQPSSYKKVEAFVKYVKDRIPSVEWLWIDTCCINQWNAAELSEAINSMYEWYKHADVCLAYLADVSDSRDEKQFRCSEWFTRGWTLQELIAPSTVIFLSRDWQIIGHKGRPRGDELQVGRSLNQVIAGITRIPVAVLQDQHRLEAFTIEERLAWSNGRQTTREEDMSYCLFGILGIAIGANYGERAEGARRRLLAVIEQMKADKPEPNSLSQKPFPSCYISFLHDPAYVEREELTHQIHAKLSTPGARVALVGQAGVGKTELAVQYACGLGEQSPSTWVFAIDAGNEALYEASLRAMADMLKIPSRYHASAAVFEQVRRWLQDNTKGRWLIILDNVEDAGFLFEPPTGTDDHEWKKRIDYIPVCDHGSMLITSRNIHEVAKLVHHSDIIKVGLMDKVSARLLVERRVGRQADTRDITELVELQEYSPLALSMAAKYILWRGPQYSVRQYLDEISHNKECILVEGVGDHQIGVAELPTLSRTSSASSMDSVFSMASVASSVSSVSVAMLSEKTLNYFVESLFRTPELVTVHVSAISEQAIGEEKYQRNLRRMIANYGKALRSELRTGKNLTAARLLQSRNVSTRAARKIVLGVGQQHTAQRDHPHITGNDLPSKASSLSQMKYNTNDFQDEASVASSDEDEAELPDADVENLDEQVLMECMKESQAFLQFKAQLLEFAHLPYAKRIQRSLRLDRESDWYTDKELVLGLADEISWIAPHLLHFHEREETRMLDYVKAWVEDSTGEEWDWWPLQPCKRVVRAGNMRVKWQTPCGNPRSLELPRSVALALHEATNTAPAFLNLDLTAAEGKKIFSTTTTTVPCSHSHVSSSTQSSNVHIPPSTQQQPPGDQPQPSPKPQQLTSSIVPGGHVTGTKLQVQSREPRFVYLCIKKGNEWHMSKLKVHKYVTDAKVFSALRRKYLAKKGAIRAWLSCWQYSHCQFYQFSKYPYAGAPLTVGFPSDKDDRYDFVKPISPRPSPQAPFGPITKEEFRDRFYSFCDGCCHSWHRKQMLRWLPSLADEERVKVLPKRKEQLQWEDRRTELFWGLKVCERISGRRVTAYMVLFNTPAIVFFFLWLFDWKHPSDLQNASIPFLASITLTMGFVSWITRNRKGDVDE